MSSAQIFVLSVIALAMIASIIKTSIRARHGIGVDIPTGRRGRSRELLRQNEFLSGENAQLKASVTRLEERIAVLERIATDAPTRLAAEIEKLK